MSVRHLVVACGLALAAAAVAACGSDSADAGPGADVQPSDEASKTEPACPATAQCFDFTEDSEGWPEVNDDRHFAGRDTYLDGTYRIGARESGSWSLTAPVAASDLADDYGVQVDADATLGQGFPEEAAWGATCWTRPVGQDRIAGFAVYVQPERITLGLYDETTGAFKPLKQRDAEGLAKAGEKSHLTLRCRQDTSSGSAVARIDAALNGAPMLSLEYANSVKTHAWQPADGIGLLAAGKGADVFYDHVVLAPDKLG